MHSVAQDVRGGFNAYLNTLEADGGNYRITVTLFDTHYVAHCVDAPVTAVPRFDERNYVPGGMTALLDAVGKTIAEFDAKHPTLPEGDRVLMVIQTDGEENSSREHTLEQNRKTIADKEATGLWGFLFMGAGADSWKGGHSLGLAGTTISTQHTARGTASSYHAAAAATVAYSGGADQGETFTVLRSVYESGDGGHGSSSPDSSSPSSSSSCDSGSSSSSYDSGSSSSSYDSGSSSYDSGC